MNLAKAYAARSAPLFKPDGRPCKSNATGAAFWRGYEGKPRACNPEHWPAWRAGRDTRAIEARTGLGPVTP